MMLRQAHSISWKVLEGTFCGSEALCVIEQMDLPGWGRSWPKKSQIGNFPTIYYCIGSLTDFGSKITLETPKRVGYKKRANKKLNLAIPLPHTADSPIRCLILYRPVFCNVDPPCYPHATFISKVR